MAPLPELDGKNVVFGEVVDDSMGLVRRIEAFGTVSGKMRATIKVEKSGLVSS